MALISIRFNMIETMIMAGAVSFFIGQIKLPYCLIGAESKNYCISRQYANLKSEHFEIVKKLNKNPNDTRIIIKMKEYGTISVPYDSNKITFDYHVNF
jgi:hypothetical protein